MEEKKKLCNIMRESGINVKLNIKTRKRKKRKSLSALKLEPPLHSGALSSLGSFAPAVSLRAGSASCHHVPHLVVCIVQI